MVAYILNPSTWEAVAQDYRDILSQCSPLPECFPTGAALCVCVWSICLQRSCEWLDKIKEYNLPPSFWAWCYMPTLQGLTPVWLASRSLFASLMLPCLGRTQSSPTLPQTFAVSCSSSSSVPASTSSSSSCSVSSAVSSAASSGSSSGSSST